ncbi:MAG: helix-turn-helix transcriptional regulator [bacterium]|nr:helix-turn-helix transcriptional regulator [bacterium]
MQQVEQEMPQFIARGRRAKARHIMLKEAVAVLKATREALGLRRTDIKAYTGIEKSNLSRLGNDPHPNPTIDTLCRYADAVGKGIVITLVEKSNANAC